MNDIYDQAQKYAEAAMRNFSGMDLPEAIRELIHSQIKLAYTVGFGAAYDQAMSALKSLAATRSPPSPRRDS